MALDLFTKFAAACDPGGGGISLLPTWYQYLPGETDALGKCAPAVNFPDDLGAILLAVVDIALRIGVIVAVGYIIYGAILFIISSGEPDKATAARQTIVNSLIGLVIALIATGVVSFIGGQLGA